MQVGVGTGAVVLVGADIEMNRDRKVKAGPLLNLHRPWVVVVVV